MRIGWWKTGGAPCCLVFCDSKLGLQGIGSRRSNSRRSRAKTSGSRRSRRTSREVTAHVCAGKWRRRKLRETVRQRHRLHLSQSRVPLGRTAICMAEQWKTWCLCVQIVPHPSRRGCLISCSSSPCESEWNRRELNMKSKWYHSNIQVNQSEIRMGSKWVQSEFIVKAKWNQSAYEKNLNWNRGSDAMCHVSPSGIRPSAPPPHPPNLLSNFSWLHLYIS